MLKITEGNNDILFVAESLEVSKPPKIFSTLQTVLKVFPKNAVEGTYFDALKLLSASGINTTQIKESALNRFKIALHENTPKIIFVIGAKVSKELTGKAYKDTYNNLAELKKEFQYECKVITLQTPSKEINNDYINNLALDIKTGLEYHYNRDKNPYKVTVPYEIITSIERLKEVLEYCKKERLFVHDYETDGRKYYDSESKATILGFCYNPNFTYIVPIEHKDSCFNLEQIKQIYSLLEYEIFDNKQVTKVAHNLKYEVHWHRKYGVKNFQGEYEDTMLMSHICDETTKNGLKDITKHLFPKFYGYDSEIPKNDWYNIPLGKLCEYNAIDCHITYLAYVHFENKLLTEDGKNDFRQYLVYKNISMFGFWALQDMEYNGALIDRKLILDSIKEAERKVKQKELQLLEFKEVNKYIASKRKELIEDQEKRIWGKINEYQAKNNIALSNRWVSKLKELENSTLDFTINFNSVQQLQELLYTHESGFKFPMNDNKPDTGKDYLNEIGHEFTTLILAYRSISKMCGTYYEGILNNLDTNNRVHPSFNLHGTVSGRLSCSNPNLQNMPSRTAQLDKDVIWAVKQVKKFFTVPENYVALQFDFSQAELRLIANFSEDQNMKGVYLENKDIHAMTAATINTMTYEEFCNIEKDKYKSERFIAKSANFGLVYGISIDGYIAYIKNNTGLVINRSEAKRHSEGIFKAYPDLPKWWETYKEKAKKFGYVRTLFGRKRRLFDVCSTNPEIQSKALRNAVNSPIQGTGGEWTIFVLGLLRCVLPSNVYLFNTVHDSMFIYCPKELLSFVVPLVKKYAENPDLQRYFDIDMNRLQVPMKVDLEASEKSWGDMQEQDLNLFS